MVGGQDSNRLQVLEMTEENGLSWSCKAELPAQRDGAASVVYDGKIWVMGGWVDGEGATASVVIYDAQDDSWVTGPPLPSPPFRCRAVTIDDVILLQTFERGETLQYKNAAWAGAVAPGGAAVESSTCAAVLLG